MINFKLLQTNPIQLFISPQVPADFLFLLHSHPRTHSLVSRIILPVTTFTSSVVFVGFFLSTFSPPSFYLVLQSQMHSPSLSGGVDILTSFTCLLYSLGVIKLTFLILKELVQGLASCTRFSQLSPKSYFCVWIKIKESSCLLKESTAKHLCQQAQVAHSEALI